MCTRFLGYGRDEGDVEPIDTLSELCDHLKMVRYLDYLKDQGQQGKMYVFVSSHIPLFTFLPLSI